MACLFFKSDIVFLYPSTYIIFLATVNKEQLWCPHNAVDKFTIATDPFFEACCICDRSLIIFSRIAAEVSSYEWNFELFFLLSFNWNRGLYTYIGLTRWLTVWLSNRNICFLYLHKRNSLQILSGLNKLSANI